MDSQSGQKFPHILLIEDDKAHQDLILRAFRDDPERFRVSIAASLLEARQILERDPPDLIIADWNLPDGKGLDILPRREGVVTIPLIITTSFGDEHLAVEIMKSGAIDYVVKSATMFRELPHIARRALREWENIQKRKQAEDVVQDTRKRLADILGFLPDAVLAIDIEGRVIAWNREMEALTGVAAADMLGKGDHEYSIPFYGVRRPLLVDLVLKDDPEVEKNYQHLRHDGEKAITAETYIPTLFKGRGVFLWGIASPLSDSAGNCIGAIEVIRDITEKKRSEELLRQREAMLETLLNAPHDTIALLDRKGIIIGINEEGARRLGGTVQSVTGRCTYDLLPGEVAEQRKARIDRVFETGEPAVFDDTRSGIYLHNEVFPVFSQDHSSVENIAIFASDITDRKKTELALQESERKYRFLIDNVRDIVWQTTTDLTFTYLSPATETLTGYLPNDLIGTSLFTILTGPSVRVVQQRLAERMEDYSHGSRDLATVFEAEIRKKDGGVLWLEISSNAVFAPDGTIAGFQGISRDITERKRAEKALIESEERFRDLFNNMSAGVVIYEATPDGKDFIIRDINQAVETIEKVKKDEIIGRSVLEVFPGVTEFGLFTVIQRVARTGIPEAHPVSMYHDNRISGWRENYVYKLPSGEVVAIYEDVTGKKQAEEKLRESEEKARSLMNVPSIGAFIIDREGMVLDVNETILTGYHTSREKILGTPLWDLVTPPIAERRKHWVEEAIRTKTMVRYEDENDGRFHDVIVTPLTDSRGDVTRLAVIAFDITLLKKAQGSLAESEERYRSVVENAAEGITVAQDGMLQYANAQLLEMTQVSAEESGNRPFTDFIHPDDRALVFDRFQRRIAGENVPQHYDFRVVGTRGKITWVQLSAVRIVWNGRPATLNFLMDITDRKQAEEKLRESRQILEGILNTIPVRVFWKDKELTYLGCNAPFAQDAGFEKAGDVIGKDDYAMGWREQAELYRADDRTVIDSGNAKLMIEEPQTTPAGDTKYLLTSKMPLRDARGDVIGVLGTYLDITDRKKAEEMLRESEVKFRDIFNSVNDAVQIHEMDENGLPGRFIEVNDVACRMLQYTREEMLAISSLDSVTDYYSRPLETIGGELKTAGHATFETRHRRKDGTIVAVEINAHVTTLLGKAVVVSVVRDITERKRAEDAIRESETRFRALIQNSSDIIRVLDQDGRIIYESPSAGRILGYPPGYLIGRNPLENIHPADLERVKKEFQDVLDR
ncbi:MAG: PAS domain S-box protein, partial [Methanoregula sp.]|nr:PAS domain S-box protein [Methanoregula sp.]